MSNILKALDNLMTVYFDDVQVKAEHGITADTAKEKYEIVLGGLRKLGKLETIEKRYGIEILTMFKAMVDGCYYLHNGKIEHFKPDGSNFICLNLDNESMDLMYANPYDDLCCVETNLLFSEYGKSWAITKEELK